MIPTAIVGGLVVGMFLRWWAVPIVAIGWAVAADVLAGGLLGAANAVVGVAPAVALRSALMRVPAARR